MLEVCRQGYGALEGVCLAVASACEAPKARLAGPVASGSHGPCVMGTVGSRIRSPALSVEALFAACVCVCVDSGPDTGEARAILFAHLLPIP